MRRRCLEIVALLIVLSVAVSVRTIAPAHAQTAVGQAAQAVAAAPAGRDAAGTVPYNPCDPDKDSDNDCFYASDHDHDYIGCDPDRDYDNDCYKLTDRDHDYGGYLCSTPFAPPNACGPKKASSIGGSGQANAHAGATGSYLPPSVPQPGNGGTSAAAGTQPVISGVAGKAPAASRVTSLPATGGGEPSSPSSPAVPLAILALSLLTTGLALRRLARRAAYRSLGL